MVLSNKFEEPKPRNVSIFRKIENEQNEKFAHPQKMEHEYGDIVTVDQFDYRIVHVSSQAARKMGNMKFPLTEEQWRGDLGISMSKGWENLGRLFRSDLLFRRPAKAPLPSLVDTKVEPQGWPSRLDLRYARMVCLDREAKISASSITRHGNLAHWTTLSSWILQIMNREEMFPPVFGHWAYLMARVFETAPAGILTKKTYPLYGIVTLFIATKVEDDPGVLPDLYKHLADEFTPDQFKLTEEKVVEWLSFQVQGPSLDRALIELADRTGLDPNPHQRYWINLAIVGAVFPTFSILTIAEVIFSLIFPEFRMTSSDNFAEARKMLISIHYNPPNKYLQDLVSKNVTVAEPLALTQPRENVKADCSPTRLVQTDNVYKEEEFLGRGTYGKVVRVSTPEKSYARKDTLPEKETKGLSISALVEISSLSRLSHPNIVSIFDPIVKDGRISYHMDLYSPFIIPSEGMSYAKTRHYASQLLSALVYLDQNDVLHRDIKTPNLLLETKSDTVLLADFGLAFLARTDKYDSSLSTHVVTLWFRAPELLLGLPYNKAIDIWSAGCIIAEMVSGKLPFRGDSEADMLLQIFSRSPLANKLYHWRAPGFLKGLPRYSPEFFEWKCTPRHPDWAAHPDKWDQLKDLLAQILAPNPKYRINPETALRHPFFFEEDAPSGPSGSSGPSGPTDVSRLLDGIELLTRLNNLYADSKVVSYLYYLNGEFAKDPNNQRLAALQKEMFEVFRKKNDYIEIVKANSDNLEKLEQITRPEKNYYQLQLRNQYRQLLEKYQELIWVGADQDPIFRNQLEAFQGQRPRSYYEWISASEKVPNISALHRQIEAKYDWPVRSILRVIDMGKESGLTPETFVQRFNHPLFSMLLLDFPNLEPIRKAYPDLDFSRNWREIRRDLQAKLLAPGLSVPSVPGPSVPSVPVPSVPGPSVPSVPGPSVPSVPVPSVPVPSVPVPSVPVPSTLEGQVMDEKTIGGMKKLAASIGISGYSKFKLEDLERLRQLILEKIRVPSVPVPSVPVPSVPVPSVPVPSVPVPSVPVPSVPVPSVPVPSVPSPLESQVLNEKTIGGMKKLAASIGIPGYSKFKLEDLERLRQLILAKIPRN